MKKLCILCDFDGTISKKDAIYYFFKTYCSEGWQNVEKLWVEKKIDSKECLKREFELVPNLSQKLIDDYLKTIDIDENFKDFYTFCKENNIDVCIVSDGIDYFIEKILELNGIKGIKVYSNHAEFINGKYEYAYPNESKNCVNNLGTCKCNVFNNMKKQYEKVVYVGDGISDYCVADKADILYAKTSLVDYCERNEIKYFKYNTFADIKNGLFVNCCIKKVAFATFKIYSDI